MRTLYATLTAGAGPPLKWWTKRRISRGKDLPDRYRERFGVPSHARPRGAVVWAHAASLGESRVLFPIVDDILKQSQASILFTTATVTAAHLVAEQYDQRVIHQFAPYDRRSWMAAFLDHWRPDLAIRAESEIWPHSFQFLAERGTPLVLVNAKLRQRNARNWSWSGRLAQATFPAVSLALCQDEQTASNLLKLGARAAFTTGDLKTAATPLPFDAQALERFGAELGERPTWIAASTHGGEDPLILDIHQRLKSTLPNVLTLIAPRHPERGALILKDAKAAGFSCSTWSSGDVLSPTTDVVIIDTIGDLGLFYRLAQAAFVGKSLTGQGGQNPTEPALLQRPVAFGPHMENFSGAAAGLLEAGGAQQVTSSAELYSVMEHWLTDPAAREAAGTAGFAQASRTSTALDETLSRMQGYIDSLNERYE